AAHGALIVFTAMFARRSGGGRGVQALAALCIATAPVFLRTGSLFQPVVFDQLWWTSALWVFALIPESPDSRRRWLALGVVLGLGLLTKFTILVLGAAILLALLGTRERRVLATPWPWAAGAVALLVGSPSIIGQAVLGWPFLQQYRDLAGVQLVHVSPASFIGEQFLMTGPILLMAGAAALGMLWSRGGHTLGGLAGSGARVAPRDTDVCPRLPADAARARQAILHRPDLAGCDRYRSRPHRRTSPRDVSRGCASH